MHLFLISPVKDLSFRRCQTANWCSVRLAGKLIMTWPNDERAELKKEQVFSYLGLFQARTGPIQHPIRQDLKSRGVSCSCCLGTTKKLLKWASPVSRFPKNGSHFFNWVSANPCSRQHCSNFWPSISNRWKLISIPGFALFSLLISISKTLSYGTTADWWQQFWPAAVQATVDSSALENGKKNASFVLRPLCGLWINIITNHSTWLQGRGARKFGYCFEFLCIWEPWVNRWKKWLCKVKRLAGFSKKGTKKEEVEEALVQLETSPK